MVEPKEFKLNNGYQYGMFHQEIRSGYYITDAMIDSIIHKINWKLDSFEEAFLHQWRKFEKIHRDYCLGNIKLDVYKELINNEYTNFAERNNCEFGECCDELMNHILRYLK